MIGLSNVDNTSDFDKLSILMTYAIVLDFCMIAGVIYMPYGFRFFVFGMCFISFDLKGGFWFLVFGTRFPGLCGRVVLGFWFLVLVFLVSL